MDRAGDSLDVCRSELPTGTSGDGGLDRVFDDLVLRRSSDLTGIPVPGMAALAALGVQVKDNRALLEPDIELLSVRAIRDGLAPATASWLRDLDVRAYIGSTNTSLLTAATGRRINGRVLAAEVQTAGRGRRGRNWLSPFARNLAVSIGVAVERPVPEIGALSLVVGIAVRRALVQHGVAGVALKWPNDILLEGRKLAGILIELVRSVAPVEVVIGIGVNVGCAARVAERIDQSIADVAEQIDGPTRNALLTRILDHVVAACREFDDAGFDPFRDEWNAVHYYRGARVVVTPTDGGGPDTGKKPAASFTGKVLDVGPDGALRIETAYGVRSFTGGEVTMRDAAAT
ncbi:MAG: biotin--[acetyl-CoA-carboxylase] ligase [Gammaproteobacteria bacterium]|nr:biotin--[acetyl-CoA-carboxylase] ligase [Gammaproteobacteria bacterium]